MTETINDASGVNHQASGQDSSNASGIPENKSDTVAYDTYRKTLNEAKTAKSKLQDAEAKLAENEQIKLEADGKKDEVIEKLRKEKADLFETNKNLTTTYAETQVRRQIELKAKELGCVDTDALVKLMDYDGLDIDDGYNISTQSLDMVMLKAKQDKSYLFSKPNPNVQDGAPVTSVSNGGVDLSKMNTKQIIEMARKSAK